MIRTFIGARISATPQLWSLHDRLARLGTAVRPVRPKSWHITLRFLGDTDESQLPAIVSTLQIVASTHPAETIRFTGLGAFPNDRRPSIVWVGVDGAASLIAIAGELERELATLGFPAEPRPFHPHLTILRIKGTPPPDLHELLKSEARSRFGDALIRTVELFRSELLPGGPEYSVIASAPLAGSQRLTP